MGPTLLLAIFRLLLVAILCVGFLVPELQSAQLHARSSDAVHHGAASEPDELSPEPAHRLLAVALQEASGEACSAALGRHKRSGGTGLVVARPAPSSQPFANLSGEFGFLANGSPRSLVTQRIRLQI
ncbi:hypothetical protein [Candidatus Laterigemmans baculatus]|nr:hypothetical protein [Candidatus Laterigemmans baculatus]